MVTRYRNFEEMVESAQRAINHRTYNNRKIDKYN